MEPAHVALHQPSPQEDSPLPHHHDPASLAAADLVPHDSPHQEPSLPELRAPPGWLKKVHLKKRGKKDVWFVAPDGEEIKSKRALDGYLKNHPGGPASSEFDWRSGETPTRRSSRISSQSPTSVEIPAESPAKRLKRKSTQNEIEDAGTGAKTEDAVPNENAHSVTKEDEKVQGRKPDLTPENENNAGVTKDELVSETTETVGGVVNTGTKGEVCGSTVAAQAGTETGNEDGEAPLANGTEDVTETIETVIEGDGAGGGNQCTDKPNQNAPGAA